MILVWKGERGWLLDFYCNIGYYGIIKYDVWDEIGFGVKF